MGWQVQSRSGVPFLRNDRPLMCCSYPLAVYLDEFQAYAVDVWIGRDQGGLACEDNESAMKRAGGLVANLCKGLGFEVCAGERVS